MSIFLGFSPSDEQTVAPALAARGINLLRAAPHDVNIIAVVKLVQLGFRFYKTVLPAYMEAWVTRKTVALQTPFHPVAFPIAGIFPFTIPPLSVSFKKAPTAQAMETLQGIGYSKTKIRNTEVYTFASYDIHDARTIRELGANLSTIAPRGSVNLDCIGPLTVVLRIFANFFSTHTYAAFQRDGETESDYDQLLEDFHGVKRKAAAASGCT